MKISWLITWGREGSNEVSRTFFLRKFFKLSIVLVLPATRTPVISVEQSVYNSWTEEPCDLQDSFKDEL